MKSFLPALTVFCAVPCLAALNVPLTIQEALYPGSISGVARTNEPFCMGVPIADSAAITSTSVLALSGASAGQFRILGSWPDGHAKWIKVCGIVPSFPAGGTATVTLTDGGSGNFGGSTLATDNGATIAVATGAATFTIKKAHFNVLDSVTVGGTTVVSSSSAQTRGLVLIGPNPTAAFPGNVTCSPQSGGSACTTIYSSVNDPNSTCAIEENGTVRTVIRCTGNHMDANGNPYMQYTWRGTFDQGQTSVRSQVILRNANYTIPSPSTNFSPDCNPNPNNGQCRGGTFNTSFKGIKSYELRISPGVGSTVNYTIAGQNYTTSSGSTQANPGTLLTGSLTGTDSAYIYQGQSNWMEESDASGNTCDIGSVCANQYTTDVGYVAAKNTTTLASDTTGSIVVGGWMDCADSSTGLGLEIGMDQFSSVYPVSLECNGAGSDIRIGMLSAKNSKNVYMMWPQWKTFENFLNFHAAALNSPANSFLKYQHYLLARPSSLSYINATNALWYPIPAAADEDALYATAKTSANPVLNGTWQRTLCWSGGTTNCIPDRGVSDTAAINSAAGLGIARYHSWGDGGSLNQGEYRYGDMLKFLQRGQTGRFLNSRYFYRYMIDLTRPHADGVTAADSTVNGFTWRSRPCVNCLNAENDEWGGPTYTNEATTNNAYGFGMYVDNSPQWRDSAHDHWYGLPDYYFLTGDESVKDDLLLQKDWFLNPNTYQYGVGGADLQSARAWGVILTGTAIYGSYLAAIGDPDAANVLATGQHNFDSYINVQGCVGGLYNGKLYSFPTGCTPPPISSQANPDPTGVSLERGVFVGEYRTGSGFCSAATFGTESGMNGSYRLSQSFQNGILVQGLMDFRKSMGTAWNNYNRALDLALGISTQTMTELLYDNGQTYWQDPTGAVPGWYRNGFGYLTVVDMPEACPSNTTLDQYITTYQGLSFDQGLVVGSEGHYGVFYPQALLRGVSPLNRIFNISMERSSGRTSVYPGDFGMQYIGEYIATANSGANSTLQDVPISSLSYLGNGVYRLGFTTPAGTCTNDPSCLRVKWAPRTIQKNLSYLLNFNAINYSFGMDPTANVPWFGANNVWPEPTPNPGSTQTFNVTTSDTTGTWTTANFSVKAMFPATTTGPAASLVLVSGTSQSGIAGQPLASPFVVEVTDTNGNPVSGTNVNFAVTAGGGTLSFTTATTNAQGFASTTLTLGATVGINTVTASSGTLTGSPLTFTANGGATGSAAKLIVVSGNNQSGTTGQPLANPFVVQVTDAIGNPISGTSVSFAVTAGGGTVNPTTATTNTQGFASTTLTLGATAGANSVTASSGTLTGSPLTFTATATGATGSAANLIVVSGNSQTGTTGQPLASPFVVKVTDASGNPVSGASVSFAVTAGGGTLNPTTATTTTQGLASTTLTLGPNAGANTVAATSGTLTGSPLTFTATGTASGNTTAVSVTWTQLPAPSGMPSWMSWMSLPYDPISNQTMVWTNDGAGIYANRMRFYNSSTNSFTALAGTGSQGDACAADLPNLPGDRHAVGQNTIDTKRNVFWAYGGVNQICGSGIWTTTAGSTQVVFAPITSTAFPWILPTGAQVVGAQLLINALGTFTIASVQDPSHLTLTTAPSVSGTNSGGILSGSESNPRQDMYYLTLNSNPALDVWHQVMPAHWPVANSQATMAYDSDDDVLFAFGSDIGSNTHDNWMYCSTIGNPGGTLTAAQTAAGCTAANDWIAVCPNSNLTCSSSVQPPANSFPGMVYDTVTRKVLLYGGLSCAGIACNQIWAYNVPTHTWTQKALSTAAPPPDISEGVGYPEMVYHPVTHKIFLHQYSNTGSPADWEYDPVADTWTILPSTGGGPSWTAPDAFAYMAYDVSANAFITWGAAWNEPAMWKGSLGTATVTPPGPAANLITVSGSGQTGTAGQQLAGPLVVKVTDANGIPVPGINVTFTVTAGGGFLSTTTVATSSLGTASTMLTLGASAGTNTVSASSGTLTGSPVTFTAIGSTAAQSGSPSTLISMSGNSQTGIDGLALASPLVVKVTDASGSPVSGTNVSFNVTAGGGTVNPTTVATNSLGLASTVLTLGPTSGTNTVTAASGTLSGSPVTFAAAGFSIYDLNQDGVITTADVQIAINQTVGITSCTNGDVNHDGVCNILDIQPVIAAAFNISTAQATGSSAFVKADTTTQGSWIGVYGADGHSVPGDTTTLPAYVNLTWAGNQYCLWAPYTADPRGLQQPSLPTNRIAATYFNTTPFTATLVFNDGNIHQVEAYFLDWDHYGRSEQVNVLDANNNVIDSRTISGFSGGQYLVWNLSGTVTIQITNLTGSINSVISGLFFR